MPNCKYGYVILHVIHIYIHTCVHARLIPYMRGGEEVEGVYFIARERVLHCILLRRINVAHVEPFG